MKGIGRMANGGTGKEKWFGKMANRMMAVGCETEWMVKANTDGRTDKFTKENSRMEQEKEEVCCKWATGRRSMSGHLRKMKGAAPVSGISLEELGGWRVAWVFERASS